MAAIIDLMMDWAHGPAGHFGGHPVPGLYHINTGTMLAKSRTTVSYTHLTLPTKSGV